MTLGIELTLGSIKEPVKITANRKRKCFIFAPTLLTPLQLILHQWEGTNLANQPGSYLS